MFARLDNAIQELAALANAVGYVTAVVAIVAWIVRTL